MTEVFKHYSLGQTMPILTARGAYSYAIATPVEGAVDSRPVVLMATQDHKRMSLCNAMEDVAGLIMQREKFAKEDNAVWVETAENDHNSGQIVQRPATMPSWGPEKPVVKLLIDLQKPTEQVASISGPALG